jgi:hypothetical protein
VLKIDDDFELVREGEIPQARQFPRALLRDSRISFGAKGLFVFLWDLPIGWRIRSSHIATIGPQKRDAVRSLLRELEVVGGLRVERVQDELGRFKGTRWILRAPHLWAIETSLTRRDPQNTTSAKETSESTESRPSGEPTIEKIAIKVFTKPKVFSSSTAEKISPPACTLGSILEIRHGIVTWTATDRQAADNLLADFGAEVISGAIERIEVEGNEPLPSRVLREARKVASEIRIAKRKAKGTEPTPKASLVIDPVALARGLKMLGQHGQAIINKIQKGTSK